MKAMVFTASSMGFLTETDVTVLVGNNKGYSGYLYNLVPTVSFLLKHHRFCTITVNVNTMENKIMF